jgi:hypothetical protein
MIVLYQKMNQEYLIENSTYFKELLTDDKIKKQENIEEIIDKFPDCFVKFMNEFIEHKRIKNLSINLETYIKIYETIDMYKFKRSVFLRELERCYQGTRNIDKLSGEGWDLYLPETQGLYTIRNVYPENLRNLKNVKTQYKFKFEITDIDSSFLNDENVDEDITELFLFHVKVFYFNPFNIEEIYIEDTSDEEQTMYTIPKWILKNMRNIEVLILGNNYVQEIDLSNMINLRKLYTGNSIQKTDFSNLVNLRALYFGSQYNQKTDLSNLVNLEVLCFGSQYNQETDLSNLINLRELEFGYDYNQETDLSSLVNLRELKIRCYYNKITNLSSLVNLRELYIGCSNQKIDLSGLINLRELRFGYEYNQETDLSSHINLEELDFGCKYNQKTDLSSLINLRVLEFGPEYNQETNLSNLKYLRKLYFGHNYNQKTDLSSLVNLKELIFGNRYRYDIDLINCEKIKSVVVGPYYSESVFSTQNFVLHQSTF